MPSSRRTRIVNTSSGGGFSSTGFSPTGFAVYTAGGGGTVRTTRLVTLALLLVIFGA